MQTNARLLEFELTTTESVAEFSRVKISAELVIFNSKARIAEIDEEKIKDATEHYVGANITLTQRDIPTGVKA